MYDCMIVRKVRRSDFPSIINIYKDAYNEVRTNSEFGDYVRLHKPSDSYFKKWAINTYKEVRTGNAICVVAEKNKKVVGSCYVIKRDLPDSEVSHVGVLRIVVGRGWRGKGIGTSLLDRAIRESRNKFDIIELYTLAFNKAKALYRGFGFRTWGVAPGYVKRGKRYIDLEYMYLKL